MKKIFLLSMFCLIYSAYGLEIQTNAIIRGVNKKAGFWTYSVKEMFYTNQNELLIKAGNKTVYFLIDENNSIIELDEDSYL